ISVLSNIKPRETHNICEEYFRGNVEASAALQIKYSNLVDALFCETNPIPVKAAMNVLGFDVGECRLPLYEMSEANLAKLKAAIDEVK
ncbi:MAG: dihydrodipicolinate synthase family protein, partial [Clostridia bacterium]|nr:dihydrodipicolinate synthase family protein [Clostridia bacterium]